MSTKAAWPTILAALLLFILPRAFLSPWSTQAPPDTMTAADESFERQQTHRLMNSDPRRIATLAFVTLDWRFTSIMNLGEVVPGVDMEQPRSHFRTKLIAGTSDLNTGELENWAYLYAHAYNRRLLELLGQSLFYTPLTGHELRIAEQMIGRVEWLDRYLSAHW